MKARVKDDFAKSAHRESARPGAGTPVQASGHAKTSPTSPVRDDADHSVATWKSYADSRLRQFCLR
jgi:hypothetical protein